MTAGNSSDLITILTSAQANSYQSDYIYDPAITKLTGGGFVVVWTSLGQDGSVEGIFGRRFDTNGSFVGDEFQVNTTTANSQNTAIAAATSDGGFVVCWFSSNHPGSSSSGALILQKFDQFGAAVGSEVEVYGISNSYQFGQSRVIVELDSGEFAFAFSQSNDSGWVAKFDASTSANNVAANMLQLQAGDEFDSEAVTISLLSDGSAVVLWYVDGYPAGNETGLFARVFDPSGAALTNDIAVSLYQFNPDFRPEICLLDDGNLLFAYSKPVGPSFQIYASIYTPDGQVVASEFAVTPGFGTNETLSKATSLGDGRFIVAIEQSDGLLLSVFENSGTISLNTVVRNITGQIEFGDLISVENGQFTFSYSVDGSFGREVYFESVALNSPAEGILAISGTVQVDQVISADPSGVTDGDGIDTGTIAYVWLRDGVAIPGADQANYTIAYADLHRQLSVRMTFDDLHGTGETVSSAVVVPSTTIPDVNVKANGNQTGEGGSSIILTVRLDTKPTDNVTITIAVSDTSEASLSASTLVFTSGNWDTPQQVTVTGLSDFLDDGDVGYQVLMATSTTDSGYSGVTVAPVSLANIDDGLNTPLEIYGDNSPNTIVGNHGNDRLYGAGSGDNLAGGRGDDRLYGEQGDDDIAGGEGNDLLYGGYDDDTLDGGDGADEIYGEAGFDSLIGGNGNDTLNGGTGADTMRGGIGDDTYFVDNTGDFIDDGGAATDTDTVILLNTITYVLSGSVENATLDDASGGAGLTGNDLYNELTGNADANVLSGAGGNDTLYSAGGDDTVSGGTGDDLVIAGDGTGNDLYDGGFGSDTLKYTSATDGILVNLSTNIARSAAGGNTAQIGFDTLSGFENVIAGYFNDTLFGNGSANVLEALSGNDSLSGYDGADTLNAGSGNDTVSGGNGRDLANLGDGADVFNDNAQGGASGEDTVNAGNGNDTINGGAGNDLFNGDGGNDSILGGNGFDVIYGGGGADTLKGGEGNDTVDGGDGKDEARLGNGADVFNDNAQGGDFGKDTVFGGNGNDTINGGAGNDDFRGEAGNDSINGGGGFDKLFGGGGADILKGGKGNDTVDGGDGKDKAFLGNGFDVFNDNAQGGDAGKDAVYGGNGNDKINGGAGNDQFWGDAGNDSILGGNGFDKLYGGANADTLKGGNGNDTLFGGAGQDHLFGGGGNDRFVFADGFGNDTVFGFEVNDAEDINLVNVGAITDFADLIANHLTDSGGIAQITVGANTILLNGVNFSDVGVGQLYSADDFIF